MSVFLASSSAGEFSDEFSAAVYINISFLLIFDLCSLALTSQIRVTHLHIWLAITVLF